MVALVCGLGVLAVAGLIVLSWDGLRAWYLGYRFIWLPEGAVPLQYGHSINVSGEVAVQLGQGSERRQVGLWSLATRQILPVDVPLAGSKAPIVLATNNAGDLLWGNVVTSFLWKKDAGMRDLASLRGERMVAIDINERGQVVGWSNLQSSNVSRAFLWSAESGIVELGSLVVGKDSLAFAINEAGWVVGRAIAADGSCHPFLWKQEMGMQDLGLPSGSSAGIAQDINDQGEVLVTCASTIGLMPFVWREKEGLVKLPAPRGFDIEGSVALNNRGTVLLGAIPFNARPKIPIAYLIVNGALKELPDAPGAKSTRYYGLNDKNWLVGVAETKEGASQRGFVALPVR